MSEGHSRRGPVDPSAGAASDAVVGHVDCGSAQTDSDRTFLRSVIENQVVPRLLIAESAALRQPHEIASDVSRPSARDVNELLHIVVEADTAACVEYLQSRRSRGMQLETVYLGLLAPVAHRLGLMWERDELSFIDVTVGLARLQSLVHELTSDSCYGALNQDATRRIVLATARNEQHAFGLLIVAEFLRLAGWEVDGGPDVESGAPLIRMVGQDGMPSSASPSASRNMWTRPVPISARCAPARATKKSASSPVAQPSRATLQRPSAWAPMRSPATAAKRLPRQRRCVPPAPDRLRSTL